LRVEMLEGEREEERVRRVLNIGARGVEGPKSTVGLSCIWSWCSGMVGWERRERGVGGEVGEIRGKSGAVSQTVE
jgi:hypothetical protein